MKTYIIILGLTLAFAILSVVLRPAVTQPQPQEPPVYCALPPPQFAEYGCTVKQDMPGYHPQSDAPDGPPVFLPLYPGSSICKVYYVTDLHNGTLTLCPVQDIRHD